LAAYCSPSRTVSKASPERCDDAVGLRDLQEEANEIEIIRGRIFIRTGNDSL
jgi:hypothetical protein